MTSVAVSSHHRPPRPGLNAEVGILCVLLLLGLALAGLAAVALPLGEAVATGIDIVD